MKEFINSIISKIKVNEGLVSMIEFSNGNEHKFYYE